MDEFTTDISPDLPNLDLSLVDIPSMNLLQGHDQLAHKPRILLLYGCKRPADTP